VIRDALLVPPSSRSSWSKYAPVFLITLLGAALRLYDLGGKTLWYDEGFSLWMARHPLPEIWRLSWLADFHPPLYYAVLRGSLLMLGDSEASLRLPSALLGILTIPLTYALGRVIGGRRLGLLAALLVAFSPLHVSYAQEARMFALLACTATIGMWGLAALLRDHEEFTPAGLQNEPPALPAFEGTLPRRDVLPWTAYIAGIGAALLTHNLAILLLAATNLAALATWWLHRRPGGIFLRQWTMAQLLILAVWLFWLPFAIDQASSGLGNPWAQPFRVDHVAAGFLHLYGPRFEGLPRLVRFIELGIILILAVLGAAHILQRHRPRNWLPLTYGLWLVAPITLMVLLPMVLESSVGWRRAARSVIWTSIPAALIYAAALRHLRERVAVVVLLTLLLADVGALRAYYLYAVKSRKEASASYVAERIRPGDAIVFYLPSEALLFDYYYPRFGGQTVNQHGIPSDFPGEPLTRILWRPGPQMPEPYVRQLKGYVERYARVWLIYGWGGTEEPFPASRMPELIRTRRLEHGTVYLFERSTVPP
jgi:4-amino-4-deoxy-L-arabinose transferase-like glycosyltransferase